MKKIIILACLFFTLFTGCLQTKKITKQDDVTITDEGYITVVGVAKEDNKEGAFVESDSDHHPYFIKELNEWPKNVHGKRIKAYGRCMVVDQRELMKKAPFRQGYAVYRSLKDVKWEVIE
jgi:hypothetical protein